MQLTSSPARTPVQTPQPAEDPGRLFNVEDFALADLQPPEIWNRVITAAVRAQASDIHFTYQHDGMTIGLRLDGCICPQGLMPADLGQRVTNHVKVAAQMDVGERRRPQDGHVAVEVDSRQIDLRISLLPTHHGEDLAVRVLDRETSFRALDELGIAEHQMRQLVSMIESKSGLVLVTGHTGAGKTTSLYAMLNHLADGSRKIVTIENPIEYDLPGISQAQVNYKIGADFATLIRSVLRHDPNVIMIGEIRDAETASAVVRAANSGRLVLATSHAAYSGAAIETLIALGAHPHFVARALRGVIAQTLVRRLCPYCTVRLEETADEAVLTDVQHLLGPNEKPALIMGRGCPHCRHTGYRGRVGLFEIMSADDEIRDMIGRGSPAKQIYDHSLSQQMISIAQAGKLAALRGLTTIEELVENVSEIWAGQN